MTALYQRHDFWELVERAAEYHQIPNPAIVEKDYFVTEALRLVAGRFGEQIIFKGGTSLSKGWKLIARFSEDIALYISPGDRGETARNTLLKSLSSSVANHPALTPRADLTERIRGVARTTVFEFTSSEPAATHWTHSFASTVRLEAGIQSGTFPTEARPIGSLLAEYLNSRGLPDLPPETKPFELTILHFRRTFFEKLYALHDKVARGVLQENGRIGTYARHYYDVSQLLRRQEVQETLWGEEFGAIARDYRKLTAKYFPKQTLPERMDLSKSPALFPDDGLKRDLQRDYIEQCAALCYGAFPTFDEILGMFESIGSFLNPAIG
jgi:predicted nucleotidyltransferase component of viral defense system